MPYELTPTYVFLVNNESNYKTKQIIHINGGEVLTKKRIVF